MNPVPRLNLDISGNISQLEAALKEIRFRLKLYRILFRGKGLEFEGFRAYAPDDDAQTIDWRTSLRANRTMVKQYKEELDRRVYFLIDTSDHMLFGSTNKLKIECMIEVAASLGHLVVSTNQKLGFLQFNDEVSEFTLASKGKRQFDYFINVISQVDKYKGSSNLENAIDYLLEYVSGSDVSVFILSDFLRQSEHLERSLQLLGSRFETVSIMIKDRFDKTLPRYSDEWVVEDPETKEQLLINPKVARSYYEYYSNQQSTYMKQLLQRSGIDLLEIEAGEPFIVRLAHFLTNRATGGL